MASLPKLTVFSGAGLSAESGLPTFRGDSGLWEGIPIRKVCHIETWEENFDAVHDFYDARRISCAKAEPNRAHLEIAEWQRAWPGRTIVLTQNIDRLLERAGCTDVIHLHGDALLLQCVVCGHEWEIGNVAYDRQGCPACRRTDSVKPGVVFFGENAPLYHDLYEIAAGLRPQDRDRDRHIWRRPARRPPIRAHGLLDPGQSRTRHADERGRFLRTPLRTGHPTPSRASGHVAEADGLGPVHPPAPTSFARARNKRDASDASFCTKSGRPTTT